MEEPRQLNRTWLCSVLFLDIVNYSSQSAEVQMEWKAFFNKSLADAITSVPAADRIILDTGDGAAVCFLGDPEDAMLCSLAMRSEFAGWADESDAPRVRIGLNLGPVKLVKDINGNQNAIGDGINVGQRIMSFASPNQILVSRSYYEVVSTLSDDYRRLFRLEGAREDKHVREHIVYELTPPGSTDPAPSSQAIEQFSPSLPPAPSPPAAFDAETLKKIKLKLTTYLGPIAALFIQRESQRATDFATFSENLAGCLSKASDRDAFLEFCRTLSAAQSRPDVSSVPPGAVTETPTASKPLWDEQLLATLRKDAAHYLGPIASIIVKRAAKQARTLEELREAVAREIESESQRKDFLRRNLSTKPQPRYS